MPNYVRNILVFNETVNLSQFKSDENEFDFNNIIKTPDDIFQGEIGKEEEELYGEKTWYRWNIDNWGTKWNSSNPIIYRNGVEFTTAWSYPLPILLELRKITGKDFILISQDEGCKEFEFIKFMENTCIDLDKKLSDIKRILMEIKGGLK